MKLRHYKKRTANTRRSWSWAWREYVRWSNWDMALQVRQIERQHQANIRELTLDPDTESCIAHFERYNHA